jgi:hypothetical protein
MVAGISAISFSVMPRAHKVVIPVTNVKGVTQVSWLRIEEHIAFETLRWCRVQDLAA